MDVGNNEPLGENAVAQSTDARSEPARNSDELSMMWSLSRRFDGLSSCAWLMLMLMPMVFEVRVRSLEFGDNQNV